MSIRHLEQSLVNSWDHVADNTPGLQQTIQSVQEADTAVHPEAATDSETLMRATVSLREAHALLSGIQHTLPEYRLHIEQYLARFSAPSLAVTDAYSSEALPTVTPSASVAREKQGPPAKLPENDEILFQERLSTFEQKAAQGEFGRPVKFLASREIEFIIDEDHIDVLEILHEGITEDIRIAAAETNTLLPTPSPPPSQEEVAERKAAFRDQARAYVAALEPETEDEARRKQEWLANIDSFSTADLINFRLYMEFGQPTLGATAPPKGATLDEMNAYAERSGWLEFRFGNGTYQQGYYDNPGVAEIRMTPCSPSELAEREAIIMQRAADLAAEHGSVIVQGGRHLNVSMYSPEETSDGQQWQPLIRPNDPEKLQTTADIVSGLSAGIEQGAWMTNVTAKDKYQFGKVFGSNPTLAIGPTREAIRIQDDYIEIRAPELQTSASHGVLWAMAAATHGLEHGSEQIAAAGHTTAQVAQAQKFVRTENFAKEKDLQLQRALQQATPQPHGGYKLNSRHAQRRGRRLTEDIYGKDTMTNGEAYAMNRVLIGSLYEGEDGTILLDTEIMRYMFENVDQWNQPGLAEITQQALSGPLQSIGIDALVEGAKAFVDRGALRVERTTSITSKPKYPGLEPEAWAEKWNASPIMQRAYGEQTEAYADKLLSTVGEHYQYIDPDDHDAVEAAIAERLTEWRASRQK